MEDSICSVVIEIFIFNPYYFVYKDKGYKNKDDNIHKSEALKR